MVRRRSIEGAHAGQQQHTHNTKREFWERGEEGGGVYWKGIFILSLGQIKSGVIQQQLLLLSIPKALFFLAIWNSFQYLSFLRLIIKKMEDEGKEKEKGTSSISLPVLFVFLLHIPPKIPTVHHLYSLRHSRVHLYIRDWYEIKTLKRKQDP